MLRLLTRHPEDFDILSSDIDPARSLYAEHNPRYASRVRALYAGLGIRTAIWTVHENQSFQAFESGKPLEYLLEVQPGRVVAYVDEGSWSYYVLGQAATFRYSRTPATYQYTSILVAPPLIPAEVKEVRRYRGNAVGHAELVQRARWRPPSGVVIDAHRSS